MFGISVVTTPITPSGSFSVETLTGISPSWKMEYPEGCSTAMRHVARKVAVSQIRYSLVVILELNGVSEVQYKDVMMIDDGKYQ